MYEWNYEVQKMIDFIDEHILENPTLDSISQVMHYSKFYCSRQFRLVAGMTLKRYIAGRRLYYATIQVRDTKKSIIDIALEYGYSSQAALTRAFQYTYGCTPSVYRKYPVPIPLPIRKVVLNPSYYIVKGVVKMSENILTSPQIWVEHIPAHRFIGLYDPNAKGYWDFENVLILMKLKVFWKALYHFNIRLSGHTMRDGIIRMEPKDIFTAQESRQTIQALYPPNLKYGIFRKAIIWFSAIRNMTISAITVK